VTALLCVTRFFALAFIFIAVVITQKDAFNVSHAQTLKCQLYPLISQSAGPRACPCVCALGDQTVRTSVLAGALTTYVRFQGEEAVSTLRGYIRNTEFKDPVTSEMKSLMNLRDVNDFWNWHEVFLYAGSLGGCVKGSWIEHLSICASTHAYAHNAQLRTSMHLRNHTIAPTCKYQYLLFPMLLIDKEYGGTPVPANKSGTILLHNRLVGDLRCV